MEAVSWRWIFSQFWLWLFILNIFWTRTFGWQHFPIIQSKWMWLLQWPKFNFVLLLSELSAQAEAIIVLIGFLPGVKFLFALCCQKDNFTNRWNYSFWSKSWALCKFETTKKCNAFMDSQIISVCQIQCFTIESLNFESYGDFVVVLSLFLSNALPDDGICFEWY